MRIKSFVFIVAALVLFVLSGPVSAAWFVDAPPGDSEIWHKDIQETNLTLFAATDDDYDTYLELEVQMAEGASPSFLPGIIILELDVDGDNSTGGSMGMSGFANTCYYSDTPYKLKVQPGIDIGIAIILRDQWNGTSTSWGNDASNPCPPTEANVAGCGLGKKWGEWYAFANVVGEGVVNSDWGRIDMPLPTGWGQGSYAKFTLPYQRILAAIIDDVGSSAFSVTAAEDLFQTYYQVTAFSSNTTEPGDAVDDFLFLTDPDNETAPICLMAVDVNPPGSYTGDLPAYGFEKDGQQGVTVVDFVAAKPATPGGCDDRSCTADTNADGKVNLSDLIQMKQQYNNTGCVTTCQ